MSFDKKKFKQTALGGITHNPTFVLALGMCPTIAMSNSLMNAIGMGLATLIVLVISNSLISLLRKIIPDKVRIPAYILIIATVVTLIDLAMQKFLPSLSKSLGVFIPLIVVNCIIFARAESFAAQNGVGYSALDGLSMGLGFTLSLSLLATCRELLAYGNIVLSSSAEDVISPARGELMPIFAQPVGGFIMLAILLAVFNTVYKQINGRKKKVNDTLQPKPQDASKEVTA